MGQINCAAYARVESLIADIMIDWIDRPTRQKSRATPDYIPPVAEPADLIKSRSLRNRIFSEASLPRPPSLPYPTRNSGTARPITIPQLRSLFSPGGRCTSYGSAPQPLSSDPSCSICLDVDSEPGGHSRLSWDDSRLHISKLAKTQWLFLPCGHRIHLACFAQASCSHPADGPHSHAALACPTCPSRADGSPPFIAGTLPGSTTLILNLPRPRDSPPLSFSFTTLPTKPTSTPTLPPTEPPPSRGFLYCPFSGRVPCHTRLPTPRDAMAHIRAHHRTLDFLCPPAGPPDLSSHGLAVCTDCVDVYLTESFDDHCSTCQRRCRRLSQLGSTSQLPSLPTTLATIATNLWPMSAPINPSLPAPLPSTPPPAQITFLQCGETDPSDLFPCPHPSHHGRTQNPFLLPCICPNSLPISPSDAGGGDGTVNDTGGGADGSEDGAAGSNTDVGANGGVSAGRTARVAT